MSNDKKHPMRSEVMRMIRLSTLLILILTIAACAGQVDPVKPETGPAGLSQGASGSISDSAGHNLLGFWELIFDFDNLTADAVPLRFTENHFNVRKFMEEGPCYDCLTLMNFSPQPDESFFIDVQFDHPFPGLSKFTGFDVRGIAIFNGTYNFPASGLVMSDHTIGDVALLNADGYTTLFNPVDYPQGSNPPILTYTKGILATILTSPATLNGYKAFYTTTPRRIFPAGETDFQTYHIARPAGSQLRVGYAVDASWEPPLVQPVEDPETDFGPNANSLEAYKIEAVIGSGLMPGCGFAPYQIDVYDHQGSDTIEYVTIESPDLLSGILIDPDGTDMGDFTRFTGNIPNELEIGEGTYRVLVGAVDTVADPFLGTMTAYTITEATIEFVPIDYDQSWRKYGKTLDNSNYNSHEIEIGTTLTEVWTHEFQSGLGTVFDSTPTIGAMAVYVVTSIPYSEKIWAVDLETGFPIWDKIIKFQPDNAIYRSTALVGPCEVYVGGSSVLSFDSEDGDFLWGFEGDDTQYIQGSPVLVDDILVITGNNNGVYAFDPYTGAFLWGYQVSDSPGNAGTPVIEDGIVYCGDMTGNAFALDLTSGDEIWQVSFPPDGPISGNQNMAAPVMAGGLIWFGSFNCHLYGLDPLDGSTEENVPLGDQIAWTSPAFDGFYLYQPTAYDPTYWQFYDGPYKVMAVATDGTVAWEFTGTDTEAFYSSPVVANGTVYVPSDAGVIYMLDPATGSELAPAYALDNPTTCGMSIIDGRLYIMDSGGILYCLE